MYDHQYWHTFLQETKRKEKEREKERDREGERERERDESSGVCRYRLISSRMSLRVVTFISDLHCSSVLKTSKSLVRAEDFDVYVGRKAWICAIHRLCYAKHGSTLCTTIHGLPAQSMDWTVQKAQSLDLCKTWIGLTKAWLP